MKLHRPIGVGTPVGVRAFSIIETLVALMILGIVFVALYSGLSAGFGVVQLSRENLRATQILQEKTETIRLYTFDQINTAGFLPTNFTDVFYTAAGVTNGLTYTGTVSVVAAPLTESYSNDMKQITFKLSWKSGKQLRQRQMSTFISRYGLQNYIY